MEGWRLIVGLGNPGRRYTATRHNAGFQLVDRLAQRWRAAWREESRFRARLADAKASSQRCLLCEPLTFMNLSGEAVGAVMRFYRVAAGEVLVGVDDADLPLGEIRLRPQGGTGGHHGLASVEQHLGTQGYARLRLGIGRRAEAGRQITGYVLERFDRDEQQVFGTVLDRAVAAVECWLSRGIQAAMNEFNGAVTAPNPKDN